MNYITNWEFIKKYLLEVSNIDELLEYFNLIEQIIKKYSKEIKNHKFLDTILNMDESLKIFIEILIKFSKFNKKDINSIKVLLKRNNNNYKKHIKIWIPKIDWNFNKDINSYIDTKFKNVEVSEWEIDDLWISIVWEGYYYKRSLNKDIEKILS